MRGARNEKGRGERMRDSAVVVKEPDPGPASSSTHIREVDVHEGLDSEDGRGVHRTLHTEHRDDGVLHSHPRPPQEPCVRLRETNEAFQETQRGLRHTPATRLPLERVVRLKHRAGVVCEDGEHVVLQEQNVRLQSRQRPQHDLITRWRRRRRR